MVLPRNQSPLLLLRFYGAIKNYCVTVTVATLTVVGTGDPKDVGQKNIFEINNFVLSLRALRTALV